MKRDKGIKQDKGAKQYVYRFKLTNTYQIGEMESWLTDMAAEGCHLDKAGFWRFRFIKGEPRPVKYRIDLAQSALMMPESELMGIYREYGWEYAGKFGEFRVFRSPEENNAPELHTDPAEQAFALHKLEKKLAWLALSTAIASVIIAAMFLAIWFLDRTPVMSLMGDMTLQQFFLVALYIYIVINSIGEAVSLRKLCESLREGRPIDHRADWRESRRKAKAVLLVLVLIEIPILAVPAIRLPQMINPNYSVLPAAGEPQPFVRLEEIEKNPGLALNEENEGTAYGNGYKKEWGVFVVASYDVEERGEISDRMWFDGSGTYSPSLSSKIYKLRFQTFAQPLADELVFRHRDLQDIDIEGGSVEKPADSRFGYTIIVREYPRIDVAAVRGNLVMSLQYFGEADTSRLLDLIDEKLH